MYTLQQELDAEKQARAQAERRVEELVASLKAMQREFVAYKDAEKLRQEEQKRQLKECQAALKTALLRAKQVTDKVDQAACTTEEAVTRPAEMIFVEGRSIANLDSLQRAVTVICSGMDQLPNYATEEKNQTVRDWIGNTRDWLNRQKGSNSSEPRNQLEASVGTRLRAAYVHQALRQRKKRDDESVAVYIREMEHMGAQGCIEREEIRRYVINGITDDMKLRLSLLEASSIESLTEILKARELELSNEKKGIQDECEDCKLSGLSKRRRKRMLSRTATNFWLRFAGKTEIST